MSSIAAKEVAKEVLETIGRGKKPNVSKIGVKKGYTAKSAASGLIQKSKTYKAEIRPLLERLEAERDAVMERMKVTRDKAKYRDLVDAMDKITKNYQLLSGGSTSNVLIGVKKLSDDELQKLADDNT